jgi:hypothetical protein
MFCYSLHSGNYFKKETMLPKINSILLFSAFIFPNVNSQFFTYEELRGNFMFEVPLGWELQKQQDQNLFIFQKEAKSIIVQFFTGSDDVEELFQSGLNTFRQSGVTDVTASAVKEMSLNNRPARWGICQGVVDLGKSGKVTLYGLLGSSVLENGGLYSLCILNQVDFPLWQEQVEKSFLSMRNPGESVHPATNVREISWSTITGLVGETKAWQHDLLSLTLSAGWEEKQKLASMEREIIGWFEYKPIISSNLMVVAYKGLTMKESAVLDAAKKTVEIAMPNAKLVNSYQKELPGNDKATISVYSGSLVSGGQEVALTAITLTMKAKKCIVNFVGFCGTSSNPGEFEKKIIEVAQTAQ